MSNIPSVQSPQHFLELLGRLYKKRDGILESSNRLVDYSYDLQNCNDDEIENLQRKITKEMNKTISDINELAPLLENPQIIASVADMTRLLNAELESLTLYKDSKYTVALNIRNFICPTVVMTRLKLTPKSIKKAYGVEIGMKDVVKLKGMFEHHQENY